MVQTFGSISRPLIMKFTKFLYGSLRKVAYSSNTFKFLFGKIYVRLFRLNVFFLSTSLYYQDYSRFPVMLQAAHVLDKIVDTYYKRLSIKLFCCVRSIIRCLVLWFNSLTVEIWICKRKLSERLQVLYIHW